MTSFFHMPLTDNSDQNVDYGKGDPTSGQWDVQISHAIIAAKGSQLANRDFWTSATHSDYGKACHLLHPTAPLGIPDDGSSRRGAVAGLGGIKQMR